MKALDRLLQRWRVAKAAPFVPPGGRVLDVGCADGALFRLLGRRVGEGVGIDRECEPATGDRFQLVRGDFPDDLPDDGPFDAITLLAVLEHIPPDAQPALAAACERLLAPGGRVVVTVPAPVVDRLLDVMIRFRLLDGMETDEHYGYDPRATAAVFTTPGLRLVRNRRFQLGLNHLFVFEKPVLAAAPRERRFAGARAAGRSA